MLAICLIAVLVGYAAGRLHADALHWHRPHRSAHDLRGVRPAREAGVRVTSVRLVEPSYVFRADPPRLERLSEPPSFVSPETADFDEEHTR